MNIVPRYTAVGKFMDEDTLICVPKYQRAYAWEKTHVEEFMEDILKCKMYLEKGIDYQHFFGGIVVTSIGDVGGSATEILDVIDGQQRLSTFCLLKANVYIKYQELLDLKKLEPSSEKLICKRMERSLNNYILKDVEINNQLESKQKLKLSNLDDEYFEGLLNNREIKEQSASNIRLKNAYNLIKNKLSPEIKGKTVDEIIKFLGHIDEVIERMCFIIVMKADSKESAYRLFQVLNNRGIALTEGELLRAKTLEVLDKVNKGKFVGIGQKSWDKILSNSPESTLTYLKCIYQMKKGKVPNRSSIYDDFLSVFFPKVKGIDSEEKDAVEILEGIKEIENDFEILKKLYDGLWTYEKQQPITNWHMNRLYVLIKKLKHLNCMPLILATAKLDNKTFSKLIQTLERFFFRYKMICNLHIGKVNKLYLEYAKKIYETRDKDEVNNFIIELKKLAVEANDDVFKSNLKNLSYKEKGDNAALKYFLLSIEEFSNEKGKVKPKNDTLVYDFDNISVEHIYPQNAEKKDKKMEPLKNNIINLTIIDITKNSKMGNKNFLEKKVIFEESNFNSHLFISKFKKWDLENSSEYLNNIIEKSVNIFKI